MALTDLIVVQQVTERLIVKEAPERAEVSLQLLMSSGRGFRLDWDTLWIGYPSEEEIGYRVTGLDLATMSLQVEKL